MLKKTIIQLTLAILLPFGPVFSQEKPVADYAPLYESGENKKSLEIIEKKLSGFYSKRVEDKRVPTGFITTRDIVKEIDLRELFRNRKARGFFIEDNSEIFNLHLYAGRNYYKLSKYDISLNHYIQSLRFKLIEYNKDDIVYYEISQVYKKTNQFNAYVNSLETAYTLNPGKNEYSLELGKALYNTSQKKKSAFHLERYIKSADDFPPEIYLMLGNLNEDLGRYLETEKYYAEYLKKKPEDGHIQFALGHIAYLRTGNYQLAETCLNRALQRLPEAEIFRRSKSYEYKGDMAMNNLEFVEAASYYLETIKYQEMIESDIKQKREKIDELKNKINALKSFLLKEQDFDKYDEYETLLEELGKREIILKQRQNEFNKFNSGRIRWNIADSFERVEKLEEAMKYYRMAISFDYNSNDAREKITKIMLKIKRGY
ncbi:MAG: tetratricopeptide repeat protein [Spirochaetes bacterium]|jgi:hypothetical protein|nr:tetratricopeptide repeat protein [Spirochaetota bacterium]